ncbi:hypothetical protein AAE250_05930 [Bacteroides sp. GD17]|jgi:hypothetical protein|uniref:hypothetical protein n=1 Tax=Bacteroides sp. GD17 TaxID=3139826 RepID=UPI0025CD61CB|nr:hypothetical protein [uncultured Bacteroides sp.]
MNPRLEQILQLESVNTDFIHLFLLPAENKWAAYEQSAVNLQVFMPEVKATLTEEVFPEADIFLHRVLIDGALAQEHSFPFVCHLWRKDYVELENR